MQTTLPTPCRPRPAQATVIFAIALALPPGASKTDPKPDSAGKGGAKSSPLQCWARATHPGPCWMSTETSSWLAYRSGWSTDGCWLLGTGRNLCYDSEERLSGCDAAPGPHAFAMHVPGGHLPLHGARSRLRSRYGSYARYTSVRVVRPCSLYEADAASYGAIALHWMRRVSPYRLRGTGIPRCWALVPKPIRVVAQVWASLNGQRPHPLVVASPYQRRAGGTSHWTRRASHPRRVFLGAHDLWLVISPF